MLNESLIDMQDFSTEIQNIKEGYSINVMAREPKKGEVSTYLLSKSSALFSINGLLYTEREVISFLDQKIKENFYIEYN